MRCRVFSFFFVVLTPLSLSLSLSSSLSLSLSLLPLFLSFSLFFPLFLYLPVCLCACFFFSLSPFSIFILRYFCLYSFSPPPSPSSLFFSLFFSPFSSPSPSPSPFPFSPRQQVRARVALLDALVSLRLSSHSKGEMYICNILCHTFGDQLVLFFLTFRNPYIS